MTSITLSSTSELAYEMGEDEIRQIAYALVLVANEFGACHLHLRCQSIKTTDGRRATIEENSLDLAFARSDPEPDDFRVSLHGSMPDDRPEGRFLLSVDLKPRSYDFVYVKAPEALAYAAHDAIREFLEKAARTPEAIECTTSKGMIARMMMNVRTQGWMLLPPLAMTVAAFIYLPILAAFLVTIASLLLLYAALKSTVELNQSQRPVRKIVLGSRSVGPKGRGTEALTYDPTAPFEI